MGLKVGDELWQNTLSKSCYAVTQITIEIKSKSLRLSPLRQLSTPLPPAKLVSLKNSCFIWPKDVTTQNLREQFLRFHDLQMPSCDIKMWHKNTNGIMYIHKGWIIQNLNYILLVRLVYIVQRSLKTRLSPVL